MNQDASKFDLSKYSAVRDGGAGLLDLSSRGRILVSGSEAVMFLNGLITNDMKTLAANSWMLAAFPNVQGRLLAVVRILNREDGFLIDTEEATQQKVVHLLDRFTLAGDFRVTDLTGQTVCYSLQEANPQPWCARFWTTWRPGLIATRSPSPGSIRPRSRLFAPPTAPKTDLICLLTPALPTACVRH